MGSSIPAFGWEVSTVNHKILLENGQELGEDILGLPEDKFRPVVRDGKIHDMEFKGEPISYLRDVVKRFVKSKVAVVAFSIIVIIVFMAIVGPYMSGYGYLEQNNFKVNLPPRVPGLEKLGICDGSKIISIQAANLEKYSDTLIGVVEEFEHTSRGNTTKMLRIKINVYAQTGIEYPDSGVENAYHWFGTDSVGRDLFSRVWMGTRVSLTLAFSVVLINLTIGLIVGSVAGYYGGWVDFILVRMMEILNYIPQLPLAILLIMFFGAGLSSMMLLFILTGWIGMAYSVRIQFYRFKGQEYVLASRTMGAKDPRIMYKYILPNAIGTLITVCALTVPSVIFQEAGLSYLGLGIQAPEPSVGTLLAEGQQLLLDYPYTIVYPGIIIVLLMLSFNLFGNGLRDAFNPSLRQ